MTDGKSPIRFTTDGYQLVVMPMLTADSKPEAEAEVAEAVTEGKPKRSRKREKVAVA